MTPTFYDAALKWDPAEPLRPPRRIRRGTVLFVALLLIGLMALPFILPDDNRYPPNHPDSRLDTGTRALFQTLSAHGINVDYTFDAQLLGNLDKQTTVVVLPGTDHLYAEDIEAKLSSASRVIVVADAVTGSLWHLPLESYRYPGMLTDFELATVPRTQSCGALVGSARVLSSVESALFSELEDPAESALGPTPDCVIQAREDEWESPLTVMAAWSASDSHPELVHLAPVSPLRNGYILSKDNAALALALLGSNPKLVVLFPMSAQSDSGPDQSASFGLWRLLPDWALPTVVLAFVATLTLLIWRGRRFGRVAYERVPISIRARESTDSLGMMLLRTKDTTYTAAALQQQARTDLTAALHLPATVSPENLISALMRRLENRGSTACSATEIEHLLYAPFMGSARDLHGWANRLAALIKEVTDESNGL